MKKSVMLSIICLSFNAGIFANGFFIQLINVTPQPATGIDSLKLVFELYNPSYANYALDWNVSRDSNNITVHFCKFAGQHDAVSWDFYTIDLGILAPANYNLTLILNATNIYSDSSCNSYSKPIDTAFVNFTVSSANALTSLTNYEKFILSPNPATNKLNYITNNTTQKQTLQILSIEGKALTGEIPVAGNRYEQDISFLPPGIYLAILQNNEQRIVKKFIKE